MFLKQIDKPKAWKEPSIVVEHGEPAGLLRDFVRRIHADIVALWNTWPKRRGVPGSIAKRIRRIYRVLLLSCASPKQRPKLEFRGDRRLARPD